MRIVIDKDYPEIQKINESFQLEKLLPTYKVRAVEADGEKFVYAKGLKKINEATDAVYDLAFDPTFDGCHYEIVEVERSGNERLLFSSDSKAIVTESVLMEADNAGNGGGNAGGNNGGGNNGGNTAPNKEQKAAGDTSAKDAKTGQNKKGLWDKVKGAAKSVGGAIGTALKGLANGLDIVGAMTKQFSKDMLKKWREAGYFNKEGRITGLGYKVMTGQVKNTVPVDTGNDK